MSGKLRKTSGMIEQIAQDMEAVGLDDLSELGRVYARLERVGDSLGADRPVSKDRHGRES